MKKYSLQVHTAQHSKEDCIFNPEVFGDDIDVGSYVRLYDPDRPSAKKLVLRVPVMGQVAGGRLEVSLSVSIADAFALQAFSRVVVEVVDLSEVELDFVEVTFKKQYIQRGNMWRYTHALAGLAVHVPQMVAIDGISAQMLELTAKGNQVQSGVITNKTNVIFRSKSARIFWLIQISSEMWMFDQNGDLYFEKVLSKFISPVLDKWKALSVTHSLTIVFFTRSIIVDGDDKMATNSGIRQGDGRTRLFNNSQLSNSLQYVSDGVYYQDFFKVVAERVADMDKKKVLQILKKEFLDFPSVVGWHFAANNTCSGCDHVSGSGLQRAPRRTGLFKRTGDSDGTTRAPSDAANGNFLEAVNTTLNILEKHYMDRDLQRTGGGIVVISAGTGIFKVEPILAQISKQRMMDTGYGIDFVSVSSPPLHSVPLFMVMPKVVAGTGDGSSAGGFFEIPHWMNTSFVDCAVAEPVKSEDAKCDSAIVVGRGGMEINQADGNVDAKNKHKWTGIREYQQAISGKVANAVDYNSRAVLRAWQAKRMEGIATEATEEAQQSERWARQFRPLPFAEILEAQARVVNQIRDDFVQFVCDNDCSGRNAEVSSTGKDLAFFNHSLVVLKRAVSSAMRQNYTSAYLHLVSLPGPLVNILMHPDLPDFYGDIKSQTTCSDVKHKHEQEGDIEGCKEKDSVQQCHVDSNATIPEWGAVDLKKVLFPHSSLSCLRSTHKDIDGHRACGGADTSLPPSVGAQAGAEHLPGYLGELIDSLPRPALFEMSSPTVVGSDGVRHHRYKSRAGTPEESGYGSLSKYMHQSGQSFVSDLGIDSHMRHHKSSGNMSLESAKGSYLESHAQQAPGKMVYRGLTYGSNASLASLNTSNTGKLSGKSSRRGHLPQSQNLFKTIARSIVEFDESSHLQKSASTAETSVAPIAKEDILKLMTDFDEKAMSTNVFTKRVGSLSRRTQGVSFAQGFPHSQSVTSLNNMDSSATGDQNEAIVAEEHGIQSSVNTDGFLHLSKRFSEPLSKPIIPQPQKAVGVQKFTGASAEINEIPTLVGMSPRRTRLKTSAGDSTLSPMVSVQEGRKSGIAVGGKAAVHNDISSPLCDAGSKTTVGNAAEIGDDRNSKNVKPVRSTKPIMIKTRNGSDDTMQEVANRTRHTDDTLESKERKGSISRSRVNSSSHQDVLEHRERTLSSMDADASGNASCSGSFKNCSSLSRRRGHVNSVASDLTFLIPGDLAEHNSDLSAEDSDDGSMTSSLDSDTAVIDGGHTPDITTTPNSNIGASPGTSGVFEDMKISLSVSPATKQKNRISIGSSAAMLESDAMARLGIVNERGHHASDVRSRTPPDNQYTKGNTRQPYVSTGSSGVGTVSHMGLPSTVQQNSQQTSATPGADTAISQFNETYRKKYMANPFREQEGKKFINARTHNRRRWTHVFPDGNKKETWQVQHALNMKSLCQPAVLPLTTDYLPPIKDLEGTQHPYAHFAYKRQTNFTSSHYSLILDPTVCAYSAPENLLKEMVCQRLTQEFQLIRGFDVLPYRKLIPGYIQPLKPTTLPLQGISGNGVGIAQNVRGDITHALDEPEGESFFHVLSMGHRIQFLAYVPSKREVKVSRYVSTGVQTAANYEYELWVPQLQRFQRITQTFRQFPEPEYNWNVHDESLLGNLEVLSETVRPKRLRYCIIPDCFKSELEVDSYFCNFKELLLHLQKTCSEGMEITVDREVLPADGSSALNKGMSSVRTVSTASNTVKLWMTAPPHENPKWIYVKHDVKFNPIKVFHVEFHWITGSAWAIEDFVTAFFRRGMKLGLKLVEVPEYFVESNLQIHPFRAQPYIPVTLPSGELQATPGLEGRMKEVSLKVRSMFVEKDVLIDDPASWIRDDDRKTDWNNYGQFDQETESLLSSPKPILLGNTIGGFSADQTADTTTTSASGVARVGAVTRRTLKRVLDRQYYHRSGLACVRVAPTGGFVWLLNSSARVSETGLNIDERREFAKQILTEFQSKCWDSLRRLLSVTCPEEKDKSLVEGQECGPINVAQPAAAARVEVDSEVPEEEIEARLGAVAGDMNADIAAVE